MHCSKCGAEMIITPIEERKHFDSVTIWRWLLELFLCWPLALAVIMINLYRGKRTVMYGVCPACGCRKKVAQK